MDDSSICKAAVGAKLAVDKELSVFSFELGPPQEQYKGCMMYGRQYNPETLPSDVNPRRNSVAVVGADWTWHEWEKAARPDKLSKYCPEGWVSQHPGEPCTATINRYREQCRMVDGKLGCWGQRSFKFLDPSGEPDIEPLDGSYPGEVTVTAKINAQDEPSTNIICHYGQRAVKAVFAERHPGAMEVNVRGEEEVWRGEIEDVLDVPEGIRPVQDILDPMEAIDVGTMQITLGPGSWRVRCRAEGGVKGTSPEITVDYDVLELTEPPQLFEKGGGFNHAFTLFCGASCCFERTAGPLTLFKPFLLSSDLWGRVDHR